MSHREKVMLALMRIAVTGNIIVMLLMQIRILSSGQHFMRITLMRHVIHDLILRGIKDIVKRDRCLHHTKVRSEMSAVPACSDEQRVTHFLRQYRQLL